MYEARRRVPLPLKLNISIIPLLPNFRNNALSYSPNPRAHLLALLIVYSVSGGSFRMQRPPSPHQRPPPALPWRNPSPQAASSYRHKEEILCGGNDLQATPLFLLSPLKTTPTEASSKKRTPVKELCHGGGGDRHGRICKDFEEAKEITGFSSMLLIALRRVIVTEEGVP